MVAGGRLRILTINAGSSSLKAALYDMDHTERLTLACQVERINRAVRCGSSTATPSRSSTGPQISTLTRRPRAHFSSGCTIDPRSPRPPSGIASCTVDAHIAHRTS
jgi:hypothetical protein